jgi:hypothetical protein
MSEFNHLDYWKAITLFGLNVATYKPALGKVLLKVAQSGKSEISWDDLSLHFFEEFRDRIEKTQMPQQSNPGRLSKLERIVKKHNLGKISENEAIMTVGREGFNDVIPRFHTIGQNSNFAKDYFYKIEFGKKLIIKDSLLDISETAFIELEGELEARWYTDVKAWKVSKDGMGSTSRNENGNQDSNEYKVSLEEDDIPF